MSDKNYTLGRGKLYFDKFSDTVLKTQTGERYFGNTPSFGLTIASTSLDHFDADEGIKTKDDSALLELTRTGAFVTDNIDVKNVALFLLGEDGVYSQAAATGEEDDLLLVKQNRYYQLGVTDDAPSGARGIGTVVVVDTDGDAAIARVNTTAYIVGDTYIPAVANAHWYKCTVAGTSAGSAPTFKTDGTTFADGTATFKDMGLIDKVVDTDYTYDADLGRLYVVVDGGIADDSNITVTFNTLARDRSQVITSSSSTVDGALRFVSTNPKGALIDYYFPYVRLAPNGEFQLKGDAWQQLSFNIEVLKLSTTIEAIYADGRPYAP